VRIGGKLTVDKHREEIRRLVAEAPDEPTYCEFKEVLSYTTPKEKGELVKDVSSFANADLEALGGYGYIVFGVSNAGRVVGVGDLVGDPPSRIRQIINGHLGRSVVFEYLTCDVDDKVGGTKWVAAIVIPDSRRRPHVAFREIKERLNGRDKFRLRVGEVWVRKTGGRELATADDIDAMYEGKLRRLVDERVRPLHKRIEELERDLREQRNMVPELGFGFTTPSSREPSPEGRPYPVLGNLIDVGEIHNQIEWAKSKSRAATQAAQSAPWTSSYAMGHPGAEDYDEYRQELEKWLNELEDLFVLDFALLNTGRAPAEDVEVVLKVPATLQPKEELPSMPFPPRNYPLSASTLDTPPFVISEQPPSDSLDRPQIYDTGVSGKVEAKWEVGKLYHDRPLFTHSDGDDVEGLLISASGYKELLSRAGDGVRLVYVVRAANLPDAHRGVVVLV
jgi:hypothetical protein